MSTSPTLEFVVDQLKRRSGAWPEIAAATGVPYHTLTKIAYGSIKDPGISKVDAFVKYFRENEISERPAGEAA